MSSTSPNKAPLPPGLKMRCSRCERTTECIEIPFPVTIKAKIPSGTHRYRCTECDNIWTVKLGGGLDLNALK